MSTDNNSIVAIIPARGGSKGIPVRTSSRSLAVRSSPGPSSTPGKARGSRASSSQRIHLR